MDWGPDPPRPLDSPTCCDVALSDMSNVDDKAVLLPARPNSLGVVQEPGVLNIELLLSPLSDVAGKTCLLQEALEAS